MKLRDRIALYMVVRAAIRAKAHTMHDLVRLCERRIGKPITIEQLPRGLPISGAVRETSYGATLYYSPGGGEWRDRIIIAHELAHLFLGHVCTHAGSPTLSDTLALFGTLPKETVAEALQRAGFVDDPWCRPEAASDYDEPMELAAEMLASKILVLTLVSDADFRSLSTYQRLVSNSSLITTFMGPQ